MEGMMKRMMGIGFVVCAFIVAQPPVWAARTQIHDAAESPQYGRKFGGMIGRGLLNAATCFVDVIVNIVNDTKAGPPLVGTLTGVAKGAGCGVLRLGSGAVDLVTFWVPGFNGFPVSDSYENCFAVSGSSAEAFPPGQPASTWDVPTTEPGAAQAPTHSTTREEPPAKKKWSK
jgi:putative exosortase-associated protein (TIGR04073 family)